MHQCSGIRRRAYVAPVPHSPQVNKYQGKVTTFINQAAQNVHGVRTCTAPATAPHLQAWVVPGSVEHRALSIDPAHYIEPCIFTTYCTASYWYVVEFHATHRALVVHRHNRGINLMLLQVMLSCIMSRTVCLDSPMRCQMIFRSASSSSRIWLRSGSQRRAPDEFRSTLS